MTLYRTLARVLVAGSLGASGLVGASAAAADFHFMKVDEVFAGTNAQPNADFVELEMTMANQGKVGGHSLQLFNASGARFDCPTPANVPNELDGAQILFATAEAETALTVNADFIIPAMLDGSSGAVCWASTVDCVSWGGFTGSTPSPAGTPYPGGIPPGMSIERTAGDSDNSQNDFAAVAENGEENAGDLGTMTCQPFTGDGGGPGGGGQAELGGLKTKVKGGRATISGKVSPPAAGEQVKLTFFANGSPLRKLSSKNATLNASSEFKKRFKVPSDSTRCKVVVRFKGAKLGQKKFKC